MEDRGTKAGQCEPVADGSGLTGPLFAVRAKVKYWMGPQAGWDPNRVIRGLVACFCGEGICAP